MGDILNYFHKNYQKVGVNLFEGRTDFNKYFPKKADGTSLGPEDYQQILTAATSPVSQPTEEIAKQNSEAGNPYVFFTYPNSFGDPRYIFKDGAGTIHGFKGRVIDKSFYDMIVAEIQRRIKDKEIADEAPPDIVSTEEQEKLNTETIQHQAYEFTDEEKAEAAQALKKSGVEDLDDPDKAVEQFAAFLTEDPNNLTGFNAKFWKSVYGSAQTRDLPPAVQKELFDIHIDYYKIASLVDDNGVIRQEDLTERMKDVLETTYSRDSCKALWAGSFSSRSAALQRIAPSYAGWFDGLDPTGDREIDNYGFSVKRGGSSLKAMRLGNLQDKLCDAKIVDGLGNEEPLVKSSSSEGGVALRAIKTKKEDIIVNALNLAINRNHYNEEQTREAIEQLTAAVTDIVKQSKQVGEGLGVLLGESQEALVGDLQEILGDSFDVTTTEEAVKSFLAATLKETYAFASLIKKIGIVPVEVVSTGRFSSTSNKRDYQFKFQTPEQAREFEQKYEKATGIKLDKTGETSIGVSVKAYLSSSMKGGTGSVNKLYGASEKAQRLRQERDQAFFDSTVADPKKRGDIYRSLIEGREIYDSIVSLPIRLTSDQSLSPEQLSHSLETIAGALTSMKGKKTDVATNVLVNKALAIYNDYLSKGPTDSKSLGEIGHVLSKAMRVSEASKSESNLRALATTEFFDSVFTPEDEIVSISHNGKQYNTSAHKLMFYILENGTPRMNKEGNFYFEMGGVNIGSTAFSRKEGRNILAMSFNAEALLEDGILTEIEGDKKALQALGEMRSELDKEDVLGKFNQLIELIQKAITG